MNEQKLVAKVVDGKVGLYEMNLTSENYLLVIRLLVEYLFHKSKEALKEQGNNIEDKSRAFNTISENLKVMINEARKIYE